MNNVEAKIWLEIFMIILVTSVVTSILNNLLMMLVVRRPRMTEDVQTKRDFPTEESLPGSLTFLEIPRYLRAHLMKSGITTISQVGDLVNPPAGMKAWWPYGFGKARQKIIREAYGKWQENQGIVITPQASEYAGTQSAPIF